MGLLSRERRSQRARDRVLFTLMLAPSVILLAVLNLYPLVVNVQSSFFKISFFKRDMVWNGLWHYINYLKSSVFWEVAWRSVQFALFGVIVQVIGGLLIALLLHQELVGRGIARSLMLLSYVVPPIAMAVQWRWMLNPLTGVVAYLTHDVLGIPGEAPHWLGDPDLALGTVIAITAWRFVPFMVIMFLARLQTTPVELYDAAKIDGANVFHEFWNVTVPWLQPTIIVAALLRTMWLFKNFGIIFLLTGGGPLYYTTTLPVHIYNVAFSKYKMGGAAALSILMLFIQLPLVIVYLRRYTVAEEKITL